MPTPGVKVHGLPPLIRALKQVDDELVRDMKDELEDAGEIVRREARRLFEPFDRFSAQGFKTVVRPTSRTSLVSIEQNLRKTTGNHPEWGALQMSEALIPAREKMLDGFITHLDHVVDRVLHTHGF